VGKRGPKKRTNLDAIWEMRKLVERERLSKRAASKLIANGKPYTWETLRKAYGELEDAGELPKEPPVGDDYQQLAEKTFRAWRDHLESARRTKAELLERLSELEIDPNSLSIEDLIGMDLHLESALENLAPLATSSPEDAISRASRLHHDEQSTVAAIREAKIQYERLVEKRQVLRGYIEAQSDIISLEKKLNPRDG